MSFIDKFCGIMSVRCKGGLEKLPKMKALQDSSFFPFLNVCVCLCVCAYICACVFLCEPVSKHKCMYVREKELRKEIIFYQRN